MTSAPASESPFVQVSSRPARLGESPVWDVDRQCLWWVDGVAGQLRCHRPGDALTGVVTYEFNEHIGCVALAMDGDLLVALEHHIERFNPDIQIRQTVWRDVSPNADTRLNDGTTDRHGAFWCAEMGRQAQAAGRLLRIDAQGQAEVLTTGLCVGNGTAFSPSGDVMYFTDTPSRKVYAMRWDPQRGTYAAPEVHLDVESMGSGVDGATVDAAGHLWCVLIRRATIACYSPDGVLLREIPAPVDLPSSLCFGGPDMGTLFLTSIQDSGSGRAISKHPLGGHLFAADVGAKGLADRAYGTSG